MTAMQDEEARIEGLLERLKKALANVDPGSSGTAISTLQAWVDEERAMPLDAPQSPPEGSQYLPLNRKLRRALVAQERRARGLRRRQGTGLWLPRLKNPPTLAQSEQPTDDRERAGSD